MIRISNKARNWTVALALSITAIALVYVQRDSILDFIAENARHEKPYKDQDQFFKTISCADRIVVRDGGFDCCGSVKDDPILFEETDRQEILDVILNLQFDSLEGKPLSQYSCMCCGGPGIDWYKGQRRVALTSLQHGHRIRWKGYSTSCWGPFRIGYGDAELCPESADWINQWLIKHGVKDWTNRLGQNRIAKTN